MKKWPVWMTLAVAVGSLMLFSSCGAGDEDVSASGITPESGVEEVVPPQPTEDTELAIQPEETPQVVEPTVEYSYVVYQPNETVDGIVAVSLTSDEEPTLELVSTEYFELLQMETHGAAILSFDEETKTLDLNEGFGTLMMSMGTSGEIVIIDSLVTTVCQWYDIEELTLTVAGEVLETGHSIYDFPLAKTQS